MAEHGQKFQGDQITFFNKKKFSFPLIIFSTQNKHTW